MFADRFEIYDRTDPTLVSGGDCTHAWGDVANWCSASMPIDAPLLLSNRTTGDDLIAADLAAGIHATAGVADIRWTKVMLARTAITDGWFDRDCVLDAVVDPLAEVLQ